jgi:uncharacterized protein (DUF1330 family)
MANQTTTLLLLANLEMPGSLATPGDGGKVLWRAREGFELIGAGNETWDEIVLVRYPSEKAFQTAVQQFQGGPYRDLKLFSVALFDQRKVGLVRFLMKHVLNHKRVDLTPRENADDEVYQSPIYPTNEQFARLLQGDPEGPVVMLNFLKYFTIAKYAETFHGKRNVSGQVAYNRYIQEALPLLARLGARLVQGGTIKQVLAGLEGEENWDEIGLMEYPSAKTFRRMFMLKAAAENGAVHRDAGLGRTRVFATKPTNLSRRGT